MPFVNESGNADIEYLSDGMTETLIKSLSGLPGLDVKPRSAVFRYKGKDADLPTVAKELNVQAVLNGRVAQRGDQLTLSLELVDARRNSVIWTESYQHKQFDIVSLQSEIAKDVSSKLVARLRRGSRRDQGCETRTRDPEAYQAYLKGRYYWNRRTALNIHKAIEQFKFATDHDPNFALAFVGLADCYAVLNEYAGVPTSETLPLADICGTSIHTQPQLAEPHATLGIINNNSWKWEEAENRSKRAIELNPSYPTAYHWYSIFLKDIRRYDDAAALVNGHRSWIRFRALSR